MYPSTEEVNDLPMYLYTIGLHELQDEIYRPEGFLYDQFFYNTYGTGNLTMNGKKYHLEEGSAFFIPANMPHHYYPDGDLWDVRWMTPVGPALKPILEKFNLEKGGVYTLHDETELDRILNHMRMLLIEHPKHGNLLASGYIYPFIMEFVYQTSLYDRSEVENIPYENQIKSLKEYISTHFMHPITLDDLCKVVPSTHQHMCRMFRESLNMRPTQYINKVRVDMAKSLLLYSDYSIDQIAAKCGFNDTSYFCKTFKNFESITPIEYRKSVL